MLSGLALLAIVALGFPGTSVGPGRVVPASPVAPEAVSRRATAPVPVGPAAVAPVGRAIPRRSSRRLGPTPSGVRSTRPLAGRWRPPVGRFAAELARSSGLRPGTVSWPRHLDLTLVGAVTIAATLVILYAARRSPAALVRPVAIGGPAMRGPPASC